jgi:hypothetical protein
MMIVTMIMHKSQAHNDQWSKSPPPTTPKPKPVPRLIGGEPIDIDDALLVVLLETKVSRLQMLAGGAK